MARRGPIGLRILFALIGLGVGVIAALTVLFTPHGKTPTTAPAQSQPEATTHGP
jgi:hypothetical protein